MKKFENYKKILLKCSFFLIIICFSLFYFKIHNYGLPFFLNADETAGMKNLLYFFGFFSYANQNIVEPIYSALINFITTGFLIFFNNLIMWKFSLNDLKDYLYLNPNVLYAAGRLSSIIFSSLSLILYFLICKKLKINYFYIFFSLLSLSLSFLFIDISVVLGKNSLLLLLFLIQYYYFIKYHIKIKKFNITSYFIFSILASLAWGINYWAATVSIYAIIYLHLEKFGIKKLNYLILFSIIFLIFGFLLNIVVSEDKIFHHLFNPDYLSSKNPGDNRLDFFINDIILGFKIFYNFEKSIIFTFFLTFFSFLFFFKLAEKKFLIINLFLIFEPILLFAIADYSYPQLRYFGPSFFTSSILSGYFLREIILNKKKFGIPLLLIVFANMIYFCVEKVQVISKVHSLINNSFIQYKIFNDYKLESKKIYFSSMMTYRESLENLNFYRELLDKKLIKLNPEADNKNSYEEISKKITILNESLKNDILPSGQKHYFFGGEYLINDKELFFNFIEKNFDYTIINRSNEEIINFLSKRYKIEKTYEIPYLPHLRYLTLILQNDFSIKKIENYKFFGETMIVFDNKEYKE